MICYKNKTDTIKNLSKYRWSSLKAAYLSDYVAGIVMMVWPKFISKAESFGSYEVEKRLRVSSRD